MDTTTNEQTPSLSRAPVQEIAVTKEVNIYPVMRTILLVVFLVLVVCVALFVIYHNGKSIYERGI
ncbi:MAG: hypothetical protein WC444_02605 [Candidatus Paceibacterota bacterium]